MDQLLSSQPLEDSLSDHPTRRAPAAIARAEQGAPRRARPAEPDIDSRLLLTRAELQALTGLRQPKRMCEWLEQRTWIFETPCRRGELPKVDRAYYLARMSGQQAKPVRKAGPQVNFMTGGRS